MTQYLHLNYIIETTNIKKGFYSRLQHTVDRYKEIIEGYEEMVNIPNIEGYPEDDGRLHSLGMSAQLALPFEYIP